MKDLIANIDNNVEIINNNEISLVSDYKNFEELALNDEKQAKATLANIRNKMALQLDGRKLKQANMLMDNIENNIDIMNDPDVQLRIRENLNTAYDFKFLAEANEKNFKMLQNLMRLDTVDASGTPSKIKLGLQYDDGKGNVTSVVTSIG